MLKIHEGGAAELLEGKLELLREPVNDECHLPRHLLVSFSGVGDGSTVGRAIQSLPTGLGAAGRQLAGFSMPFPSFLAGQGFSLSLCSEFYNK